MMTSRARTAIAVMAAGALVALAGCGGEEATAAEGGADGGSSAGGESVELTVSLFGTFGMEEAGLFDQYEEENPGVTISYETTQGEDTYWPALLTKLNAGSGASDIQGIEVARIRTATTELADKWVDLTQTEAADQLGEYAQFKQDAATTEDGAVVGLGTDIGPTGICYRTDLLEEAGLPTDPDELAAQMGSWEDYLALGEQYKASAPEGSAWTDSAGGLYNAIISTESEIYYDEAGELVYDSNPAVKAAFDLSAQAAADDLTAKFAQFEDPEWNPGFGNGAFATIACPSWMLGYIKGQAGDEGSGKWGVTSLPGGAAGNWGGAYLGVPASSENQEEAVKLAMWLTAPEQQEKVFAAGGNFPSNTTAIDAVADTTDEYFSDAPIGQIFGDIAKNAPTQILGPDDGVLKNEITNALLTIEVNDVDPETAWTSAQRAIDNQLG
ncbi:ABC transporter substrate-binding protein [Aquipuribacter hungaricus]